MEEHVIDNQKESPTVINIFPITKGRRILVFLADFFICLLLSFLLFNIAVYPIAYSATNYKKVAGNANQAQREINMVLASSNLVYFEEDPKNSNINDGMSYTFDLYIKDILNDVDNTLDTSHDVFYTYYVEKLNNKDKYISLYEKFDEKTGFFVLDKVNYKVSFTNANKELFEPLNTNKANLSDDGKDAYDTMFNKFFLTYYSMMLSDMEVDDVVFNDVSYIAQHAIIINANKIMDNILIVSSVIAYVLGWAICYLVVPLCNQYRKTIGMLMMRIHRIDVDKMKILTRSRVSFYSIYSLFTNLGALCFMPLMVMSIDYIFNLTIILWLSLASAVICLISLIFLLFNKGNQTLVDSITRSAYISNDSLDEIYRARGYYI